LAVAFCSCNVDFDPNTEWKETTIVYSLLDQDDDTTFVRVEKAFLGKGNYIEFAEVRDSIYYKEEDIDVKMYEAYTWDENFNTPSDTFQFIYTTAYQKQEGEFSNEESPIYYCVTRGRIRQNRLYKLVVTNLKTGNIVSSTTSPLATFNILKPESNNFVFNGTKNNLKMDIEWNNKNNNSYGAMPKLFQPMIRFYYMENNVEKFIDVSFGKVVNQYSAGTSHKMTYTLTMQSLLNALKTKLDNNQPKQWTNRTNPLELTIAACDIAMYDYMNINRADENMLTERPFYTNIDNGVGLFASRRRGIKIVFDRYTSLDDFVNGLVGLNVGFTTK
jgi:hypothetical protein